MEWPSAATFDLEISIHIVFPMLTLEAMAVEVDRGIYADVQAVSDLAAGQLAVRNLVAGA